VRPGKLLVGPDDPEGPELVEVSSVYRQSMNDWKVLKPTCIQFLRLKRCSQYGARRNIDNPSGPKCKQTLQGSF
jgi:hypothetical protein